MKALLITLPLFFLQCSTGTSPENGNIISDQIFPIAEGNYWIYKATFTDGDSVESRLDTLKLEGQLSLKELRDGNLMR